MPSILDSSLKKKKQSNPILIASFRSTTRTEFFDVSWLGNYVRAARWDSLMMPQSHNHFTLTCVCRRNAGWWANVTGAEGCFRNHNADDRYAVRVQNSSCYYGNIDMAHLGRFFATCISHMGVRRKARDRLCNVEATANYLCRLTHATRLSWTCDSDPKI